MAWGINSINKLPDEIADKARKTGVITALSIVLVFWDQIMADLPNADEPAPVPAPPANNAPLPAGRGALLAGPGPGPHPLRASRAQGRPEAPVRSVASPVSSQVLPDHQCSGVVSIN